MRSEHGEGFTTQEAKWFKVRDAVSHQAEEKARAEAPESEKMVQEARGAYNKLYDQIHPSSGRYDQKVEALVSKLAGGKVDRVLDFMLKAKDSIVEQAVRVMREQGESATDAVLGVLLTRRDEITGDNPRKLRRT